MKTNHFYRQVRLCIHLVACLLALGAISTAPAHDAIVTVQSTVKSSDLDLRRTTDVRELYRRLSHAAAYVCDSSAHVGLEPPASPKECYETALGRAVRSINRPSLTLEYLATHTLLDAARHGIAAPARVAETD